MVIESHRFSFKKMHWKISSANSSHFVFASRFHSHAFSHGDDDYKIYTTKLPTSWRLTQNSLTGLKISDWFPLVDNSRGSGYILQYIVEIHGLSVRLVSPLIMHQQWWLQNLYCKVANCNIAPFIYDITPIECCWVCTGLKCHMTTDLLKFTCCILGKFTRCMETKIY